MVWYGELASTLDEVWLKLGRGVHDRRAAARHPTLATVGPGGGAEARTVVLRGASRATNTLEFHTDALADKIEQVRRNPKVTVHVWDERASLQIRVRADAAVLTGEAVTKTWHRVPAKAQSTYGRVPSPGASISDATAYQSAADPQRFAVLCCAIIEIETLHLRADAHRRAVFEAANNWAGQWLCP